MATVKKVETLPTLKKVFNTAAYARVSVEKDSMLHSLSAQVSYYSRTIQEREGWHFVGVYADEAKTGTKDSRPEFQRMLADARAGKIDLIITKSISRFARNTLTLLKTVRELKAIGVDVYFEEQNLYSISSEGEMLLTLLASVAQEESRQVSENMKWRIKRDFRQGLPWGSKDCYGYKMVNKKFIIVPEQAEVVKRIFQLYIDGCGKTLIAKTLNRENVPTLFGARWKVCTIDKILCNVNYTGSLLLQKTFVEDYLTKKQKINRGELNKYLVENDHESIISMETFEEAARIRVERRKPFEGTGQHKNYPFAGMIFCGKCGRPYRHKVTKYNRLWICSTFNTLGKEYCAAKQVSEEQLYAAINNEFGYTEFDEKDFKSKVKRIVVLDGNRVVLEFHNGKEKELTWQLPSRKDSWTDEMKEVARKRNAAQKPNERGSDGRWLKSR